VKSILGVSIVLILLVVGLLSSIPLSPIAIGENIYTQSINNSTVLCDEQSSVTWTSRTQPEPLSLENESCIAGDHIVVNATFHQELNVTRCEMRVWSGFTYTTTRPLVVPTDPGGVFSGIIDPAQFDWVVIKGIEKDLPVSISCNFTNNDCDFMAWDGTLDQSEYTYSNNMLDMASGDNPETDSLIWTSDNDTMVLGCLNYESTEIGNWTLNFQVGIDAIESVNASSIEMDTYFITRQNQTCSVCVTGYTDLNESIVLLKEQVRICNFFAPNVTIARNLTRTWHLWDSSGWLEADYMVRVRAYSLDFSVPGLADVSDPPRGYWPGDYGDGIFFPILAPPRIVYPLKDVCVRGPSDIVYELGASGNNIDWVFYYTGLGYWPQSIYYEIYRNSTLLSHGHQSFHHGDLTLSLNVDELLEGVYNYTLYYENPGDLGGFVRDVVFVFVDRPSINTTTPTNSLLSTFLLTFLVISIPVVALIALIVIVNKGFDLDNIKRMCYSTNSHG